MSKGIDYGRGTTNIDRETLIRYGVIPQNDVLEAWADASEAYYGEPELDENGEEVEMDDCAEALSFFINDDEYEAESGQDGDIFIIRSPFYTRGPFCSPCAPGAIYIRDAKGDGERAFCFGGERAFCFGHDWFESGKAPYPIWKVSDGSVVLPDADTASVDGDA